MKKIIDILKQLFGPTRKLVPGSDEEKEYNEIIREYLRAK